jgi:hypothetical protein
MQATIITGQRHADCQTTPNGPKWRSPLAQPCHCGCAAVVGLTGYVVMDSDTPKLAALTDEPTLIAEFPNVPYHRGAVRIAYSYVEVGLGVSDVVGDAERHEAMQLFTPAPNQIPGQLNF